jgi:zinc protease
MIQIVYPRSLVLAGLLALTQACSGGAANEPSPQRPVGDGEQPAHAEAKKEVAPTPPKEAPVPELAFPTGEAFRDAQPVAGQPRAFQLPQMKRFKLENGIEAYLVEQHQLPTVTVELNFDGGAITDPKGKEGLASLCTDLITEGTEKLEKLALQEALADTASNIFSYAGADSQGIMMTSLSKHVGSTHALFVDTVLTPGLRQEDLDRIIKRRVEELKQTRATPGPIAQRVSAVVLYGPKHPRGRVETDESLGAITVGDCKAFHQSQIKPKGARLFIVGDMTEAQVRQNFDNGAMAQWRGKASKPARQPRPKSQAGKIFLVDVPGAAQSSVYVMHFGPQRKARDYMANEVMSDLLGGSFASRINMNLREDKGYSYGARSGFQYNRDYGYFYMTSSVRSDSTYQTVLEMMDEISALKSKARPATEPEISREKNGAILGLPGGFETARQALSRYRMLVYFGLPLNYYNTYVDQVAKVTLDQVQKSAAKHLDAAGAKIIVVGDANGPMIRRAGDKDEPLEKAGAQMTLVESLEDLLASGKLGKGTLVRLDVDGKPIKP